MGWTDILFLHAHRFYSLGPSSYGIDLLEPTPEQGTCEELGFTVPDR